MGQLVDFQGQQYEFPEGINQDQIHNYLRKKIKAGEIQVKTEETEVEQIQTPPSVTQPVVPTDQVEPAKFSESDLDTNEEWLETARIIYENEEGKKYPWDNKRLSDWLKNRHSELAVDLTSMAATAYRAKDFDPDTQLAWLKSMQMYENTSTEIATFLRGAKNYFQDPVSLAATFGGAGILGVAKHLGTKAASTAARWSFQQHLKNALQSQGLTKEAIKEVIKEGGTKGLKKEVLTEARSKAARELAKVRIKSGAALEGTYLGSADIASQNLDIALEKYGEDTEFDPLQLAGMTGLGALSGVAFAPIGMLATRLGHKKAGLRNQAAIARLEETQTPKVSNIVESVIDKMSDVNVRTLANRAQRQLDVDGEIKLKITGKRAPTIKARKATTDKTIKENLSLEEITDVFEKEAGGFQVQKVGPKRILIKKVADVTIEKVIDGTPRTFAQRVISGIGRRFSTTFLGPEGTRARARLESALPTIERNVHTRFQKLKKALKKELNIDDLSTIPPRFLRLMDDAFRGDTKALAEVEREAGAETVAQIQQMRDNIIDLQTMLLKSGAIRKPKAGEAPKEDSLFAKITSSMDPNSPDPQLYVTRQYEVFDNPHWSAELRDTIEGRDAIQDAKQYILSQAAGNDAAYRAIRDKRIAKEAIKDRIAKGQRVTKADRALLALADTAEERELIKLYEGKGGYGDTAISDILTIGDESDIISTFKEYNSFGRSPLKILTKRGDLPDEIRLIMGEYKDPFTNYANTAMKLFQTVEAYKYEKSIADLIKGGKIKGAALGSVPHKGIETKLMSALPRTGGVSRPFAEEGGMVKPLDGLYGTSDIASAIKVGNEMNQEIPEWAQGYLLLQGHTRSAKTVWSPTGVARNFLSAGMMALGAGYFRPANLRAIMNVARGLAGSSDVEIRDLIEKGIALNVMQTGTELGAFKGALRDAGEESFWKLNSPVYKNKRNLIQQAKKYNTKAVKFYQSMDDMWKQFAFLNERQNYKQVLIDNDIVPDEEVRRFMSGDGNTIIITKLDEYAAEQVNKHMQNYGGVPQFVRAARLLPMADFLAFTTEIIRTQKNIIKSAFVDMKKGNDLMKTGQRAVDETGKETGLLKGQAQAKEGERRLGSIIAAQSAAPALATTTALVSGLDQTEPGMPYTIREGMAKFDPDFDKGASYWYYGKPENGTGKKINLDYINPWAKTQLPIRAALDAMNANKPVDEAIDDAFNIGVLTPIWDTVGPSMIFEAGWSIVRNVDKYGRPIFKETDTAYQKLGKGFATTWEAFEPGFWRTGEGIYTSLNLEGKEYGVRPGKTGTRLYFWDQIAGISGVKPQHYDIKDSLRFKANDIKNNMGEAGQIFTDTLAQMQPQTEEDIIDAYTEALEKQHTQAMEMFDLITAAKSTGMNNADIYKAITKDGLFTKGMDKQILMNMIKKGVYIPPPPVTADAVKYGIYIKEKTGQKPPVMEALKKLQRVHKLYAGAGTGIR